MVVVSTTVPTNSVDVTVVLLAMVEVAVYTPAEKVEVVVEVVRTMLLWVLYW